MSPCHWVRALSMRRCLTLAVLFYAAPLLAQQVNLQTPLRAVNDGFFERIGTNFSLGGPNWFLRVGGPPVVPPFGGGAGNQGAGVGGGFAFGGGGVNGGFNFTAGQGSQRSNVMQSGNLTVMNGYPGYLSDVSQSPFVIGSIPVVGDAKIPWLQQHTGEVPKQQPLDASLKAPAAAQPNAPPLRPRNEFAADPALVSVAELRERQAAAGAARQSEVQEQLAKAREAVAAGKPSVARIYYQMAVRRAEGPLKEAVLAELATLTK